MPPTGIINFSRLALEDTATQRVYWLDIDRDQTYIIYVRAISEYGVYSEWPTGYLCTTNSLTIGSDTLVTLTNARDTLARKVTEAQTMALQTKLESTVAEVQRQVAAAPTMTAISNISTRLKALE